MTCSYPNSSAPPNYNLPYPPPTHLPQYPNPPTSLLPSSSSLPQYQLYSPTYSQFLSWPPEYLNPSYTTNYKEPYWSGDIRGDSRQWATECTNKFDQWSMPDRRYEKLSSQYVDRIDRSQNIHF
jgi:hypothetical protein